MANPPENALMTFVFQVAKISAIPPISGEPMFMNTLLISEVLLTIAKIAPTAIINTPAGIIPALAAFTTSERFSENCE